MASTTVVRPFDVYTSIVNPGELVTVVTAPGGAARLTFLANSVGDPIKSSTGLGGGETKVFGPFLTTETFRVTCSAASATVVVDQQGGKTVQTNLILESLAQKFTLTSPFCAQKPILELTYADFDTRSFRQMFQVPFTGPCQVRAVYQTDATSTGTLTNTAFAGGRALSEDNPLDDNGSPSTWAAVSGTALSAASATLATDGKYGIGKTAWVSLVVPKSIDGGKGGYIYVGTQSNAASKRCQVSASSANYETHVNARLGSMKYRACANASGDNVSTNQNAFVNAAVGGSAFLNNYHGCAWIEVRPAPGSVMFLANGGDSTFAGYGTNVAVHPMGYCPLMICANLLTESGTPTMATNFGSPGEGALFYNNRLREAILDTQWKPYGVFIQGFTYNDGFTDANVSAGIALAIETGNLLLNAGVKKVWLSTVTPPDADDATKFAARMKGNNIIRSSGFPILDIDLLLTDQSASPYPKLPTEYTAEGLHYRIASSEMVGAEMKRLIESDE